jgi:hypothetical protein
MQGSPYMILLSTLVRIRKHQVRMSRLMYVFFAYVADIIGRIGLEKEERNGSRLFLTAERKTLRR